MISLKKIVIALIAGSGFIFSAGFLTSACSKSGGYVTPPPPPPPPPPPVTSTKSVLFVGNSLTYTNDLPIIVVNLARQKGIDVKSTVIAKPNYALEDHWIEGDMQQLINTKKFDFVIVQQGPSSQADGRAMLLDYGQRIKDICTPHNTKLAFFMVWPAYQNFHTFDGVIRNYSDATTATGSLLCPVGSEWKTYFGNTNDYSYYGPDGFHPSQKGSEVAAAIIVRTLF